MLYADCEEMGSEDGPAANVLDGDAGPFWHTEWSNRKPAHPHQVVIDLGQEQRVTGLRYLPRQDSRNGRVKQYEVYVTTERPAGL